MRAELSLRILHISDLHVGSDRDSAWRTRRVLGEAWTGNLSDIKRDGHPIDLVCFTGDIAWWGTSEQYEQATPFVDALLEELGVPRERFFCVPGNHDVQRKVNEDAWRRLRDLASQLDAEALSRWIAGGQVPLGADVAWRDQLIERQTAYRQWLRDIGRDALLPGPHQHLGYRESLDVGAGDPLHVIGLDSAWLAGDDHDAGKLRVTEDQIARLCTEANGDRVPGWIVALVHHPLGDLADAADVRRGLARQRIGLLMHGHLHDPDIGRWIAPSESLDISAAGCLYQSNRYPNSAQVIDVRLAACGRVVPTVVWFRSWSDRAGWHSDNSRYPGSVDGRLRLERTAAPIVRARGAVVGRDESMARLKTTFAAPPGTATAPAAATLAPCCVIDGMAGVGKTWLAEHFVDQHWLPSMRAALGERARLIRLTLDPLTDADPAARRLAEQVADKASAPGPADTVWERLGHALGAETLLLIENVDNRPQASAVGELVNRLPHVSALVTARYQQIADAADRWTRIALEPLSNDAAVKQIASELGEDRSTLAQRADLHRLARALGGLPLALHIAAGHLRAGHSAESFLREMEATGFSLEPGPADPRLTEDRARAIVRSSVGISWQLWQRHCLSQARYQAWPAALEALAHGPAAPVGESLGAAIADLDPTDFRTMTVHAATHSLLQVSRLERRHALHPLVTGFLRSLAPGEPTAALERAAAWFESRFAETGDDEQGRRWNEAGDEDDALGFVLRGLSSADAIARFERAGSRFAINRGPFGAWRDACRRWLAMPGIEGERRSNIAWTLCWVAMRAGDLDLAYETAKAKRDIGLSLGEEREAALAAGAIADIHEARGQLDEALRIRREDVLPVFERLPDVRERAVTMGKIADILQARGDFDEALRIRREDELPVYERLGDVRSRAVTMGQVADILQARGQLDEALRIRREDQLPVYERLGDVRARAVTMGKIADILLARGQLNEALRIRREDQLPIYERLGDVRSRAATMGKIADILQARGDFAEALRIRHEDELPVYERLGDVRARAATMGKVADILRASGDFDEALRIRREEQLPVYERLGDVQSLVAGRARLALNLLERGRAEDRAQARSLLELALGDAHRLGLPEAGEIESTLRDRFGKGNS